MVKRRQRRSLNPVAIIALVIPLSLGSIALVNFDFAFKLFHAILFPGKDNWLFDPYDDPIIMLLPEDFFMACGIFIAVSMLTICGIIIARNIIRKAKAKK